MPTNTEMEYSRQARVVILGIYRQVRDGTRRAFVSIGNNPPSCGLMLVSPFGAFDVHDAVPVLTRVMLVEELDAESSLVHFITLCERCESPLPDVGPGPVCAPCSGSEPKPAARRCMRVGCSETAQGVLPFCSRRCFDLFGGRTD